MRYTVKYEEFAGAWAVIDTKSLGRVIGIHDNAADAEDAAWAEEERWYKCYPLSIGKLNPSLHHG
ncbi:MAG: hypothetical protein A3G18_12680 [Rhodospirillales bacterium RIFCSPLOWO2_12_FULL_58_28]|nr:MAG: hypothetical protein A3H92_10085 [Rhodospirillales bacterium RIFCSPLOWO2_02_FULL_58_16]OHC77122.1 MAG: hypothetical protein A3G18_12680 [Rhodospirillales bacterium RIFCSPLOWO2_12_FULL_58_28]